MLFSLQHGHVMAPKLIILLYVYSKQPHYNTVSLTTRSASMDPKDSVMRLYCIYIINCDTESTLSVLGMTIMTELELLEMCSDFLL